MFTEAERGKRAKDKPQARKLNRSAGGQGGTLPSDEPPKWKQQGFASKAEMQQAELLANHPEGYL